MMRLRTESPPVADPTRARPPLTPINRFFRSPKGYLLLVFVAVVALALFSEGAESPVASLALATATAVVVDLVLIYLYAGRLEFPSGAVLTGLIVGLILSPTEPAAVVTATSTLAIASKYLFRTRWSNVFNPAALALVIAGALFGSAESWWGASPDLPILSLIVLLATGFFIADRVNKLPMVLVFVGVFYLLFSASAFLGDPARVAEVFRAPDANAALFFAFFMLDDPPTSPTRYGDQIIYALVVAGMSFAVYTVIGVDYYLPAALLVGNLWESLRRLDEKRRVAR